MNTKKLAMLILITLGITLGGCATPKTAVIDGKEVPRPTLGYTDHDLFAIQIKRAWPQTRGASSGLHADGGHVWGRVCAADVQLDAAYKGNRLDLIGALGSAWPSAHLNGGDVPVNFEARDRNGMREVVGDVGEPNISGRLGPRIIDFKYNHEALVGQIGWKHFNLRRDGDRWIGTVTEIGETSPFVVDGVDELWSMPAPAQVTLLPFMMTCAPLHAFERNSAPPDPQLVISFRDKSER